MNQEIILDLIFFFVILRSSADVEWQRFFVYLLCTAKPAFVGFWDFSVFGKSITYLFLVPLGRSIPSLDTIFTTFFSVFFCSPMNGEYEWGELRAWYRWKTLLNVYAGRTR